MQLTCELMPEEPEKESGSKLPDSIVRSGISVLFTGGHDETYKQNKPKAEAPRRLYLAISLP